MLTLHKFHANKIMSGRDPNELHRVASPLELLFDLVFVVAVSAVASELHHALVEHHIGSGLFNFLFSFIAIFWAWINYTWFASAYDTDDNSYRILTMVQMFGALVMAVGVADIATNHTSTQIAVLSANMDYFSSELSEYCFKRCVDLQKPLRKNMPAKQPISVINRLKNTRRNIETVIGQLSKRFNMQKVRLRKG